MSAAMDQAIGNLIRLMKDELNQLVTFIDDASKIETVYQEKFALLKLEAGQVKETISQTKVYSEGEVRQVITLLNETKQLMVDALADDEVNRDYMDAGLVDQMQQLIDDMGKKMAIHRKSKAH